MARALVDTGAVVALINRADRHHAQAAAWFRGFRGQLLTTEAVVTETAYVLAASPQHQHAALTWVQRARAAGTCDYADASLIWLAEKTGVLQIATVDQDDFSVYRVRGRRAFRILIG